ncbi:MAG: sugar phosphate nucleotidyltransferase [Dehalococcoidia bacterium]|nr:sugar phosphate nucleotidyltransferase [Dehalococcoidia bacterium]MDD5493510.1 sugar phosphate nucleotidyltransferase [Dehalococcoidia bacterium]
MKVIFLCGGIGKRMFPLTEDKFLFNFIGKTLLEHQIDIALKAGLKDFVIIGNPGNMKQIESITDTVKNAHFEFALQRQPLGIADALKCAAAHLNGEILVVNPNDVFAASAYTNLLRDYNRGTASSYMLGYEVNQYFPGGYLAVNSKNELTHIVEKPEPGTEPSKLVNILLHLHTDCARLLEYIDRVTTTRDDVYESAMDSMVKNDYKVKVVHYNDFWAPIKYPWHLFDIVRHFLDNSEGHIASSASISDRAVITGKVIIGENVRILENTVIRGPSYIGQNTVIGNSVLVRDYSHIGNNCVVGFSTEVKCSYVGDSCWFHSCYIGDSIIGNTCSFGAGTVTANFRFDEKEVRVRYGDQVRPTGRDKMGAIIGNNCKTGINASILPGRRMGPNSIIGSHVCLMTDLEPGTTILNQSSYQVVTNEIELDETKKEELKNKLGK